MPETFADAVALHEQGRLDDAVAAYERLLEHDEHFGAAYNLSLLLAAQGEFDRALLHAQTAVRLGPGSAEAHDHLGGLYVRLGQYRLALSAFEAALRILPGFARACNNLGAALQAMGRIDESIAWFERAIALLPQYADAHTNLGTALAELDRFEEARQHLTFAAATQPQEVPAYGKLGALESTRGDFEKAIAAYRTGLSRDPRRATLYRLLANAKPLTPDDPEFVAMERLAGEVHTLAVDQQLELHFALGKAYMDNKRYGDSISHFIRANALKRRFLSYNESATLASMRAIATAFDRTAMASLRGCGDPSTVPLFIIGMPRSGSTLVEQILAGHPQVHAAGELETFGRCVDEILPKHGAALTPGVLCALGSRYVREVTARAPDAARITDKMPANFRYAGLIALALPNARIVHTRRDPLDTCLSCFAQNFRGGQEFSYDLAELGRYYRAYEALMAHWREALPEGTMLEVRYEELVDDLETHARRIVEHAGLPWDPACLTFHTAQRPVRTASAAQVRRPLYRSSVGRWLEQRELLRPLVDALEAP